MTHDPLCPCESHKQPHIKYLGGHCHYCQCDLIATVADRERAKATKVTTGGTFGPGVDGITDADVTAFLEQI
jgi:hypothetical protein